MKYNMSYHFSASFSVSFCCVIHRNTASVPRPTLIYSRKRLVSSGRASCRPTSTILRTRSSRLKGPKLRCLNPTPIPLLQRPQISAEPRIEQSYIYHLQLPRRRSSRPRKQSMSFGGSLIARHPAKVGLLKYRDFFSVIVNCVVVQLIQFYRKTNTLERSATKLPKALYPVRKQEHPTMRLPDFARKKSKRS